MEATLTQALADYIDQRKQTKLEPLQKALDKVLENGDEVAIAAAKAEYAEKAAPFEVKFQYETWITDAAKRAKQLTLATHPPKYTHGDSKASKIFSDNQVVSNTHVNSAILLDEHLDFAGNSAAFDVASFLKVQSGSESLITQLQSGQVTALNAFTENDSLLQSWVEGFKLALSDETLSSHNLSKQVYFPISPNTGEYHLLSPLFSTQLAHELHKKIKSTRSATSTDVRKARKANKYHYKLDVSFPHTAIQVFGGTKPQNISQLNQERFGETFLLNCAPPDFKQQAKPPLGSQTLFNRQFYFKVAGYLREFKRFLETLRQEQRNFKIRYKRDQHFIAPILDQLMIYAASIQAMPAGWTSDNGCKLKHSHALWLDVNNTNEAFQREREKLDWQNEIAADFASWLNRQLKSEEYLLSDSEHAYFAKLCLHQLKLFERNTPKQEAV